MSKKADFSNSDDFENARKQILELSKKKSQSTFESTGVKAWEYELREYQKRKKLEAYLKFTSALAILSFLGMAFLLVWIFVLGH